MMAQLSAWLAGRTERERLLLRFAAVLIFALILPLWAWSAASSFRANAAAELAGAREVRANVTRLAEAASTEAVPALEGADGTLRGLALAAAQAQGLTIARVEPASAGAVRVAFAPASSLSIYRWMDAVSRRGAFISRTAIVRSSEGDLVAAEFDVAPSP